MIKILLTRTYSNNGPAYPAIRFTLTLTTPGYWLEQILLFFKMGLTYHQAIQFKEPDWNGRAWVEYDDIPF